MYLHSMRISAIGPFADEHLINFAELGEGGLFLLEGPTGSGKSTIIDAIVFALYGKVASKDASEDRLRSTHVGPEVASSVDLIFETGHGTFRILRSPAYDRPKRRGTGTTRQNSQVQLWRLSTPEALGSGEQISTRAEEVGAEVTKLIGLNREQFVQTIVLPQGEFANFLSAKPEDRRGLLQKVFGTEVYEQIQEELRAAKRRAEAELKEANGLISRAVANFDGTAGLDEEQSEALTRLVTETDGDELLGVVDEHLDRLAAIEQEASTEAAATQEKREATRVTEEQARKLQETVTLRADLTGRAEALAEQAAEHSARVSRADAATRAGRVAAYLAISDRSVTDFQKAEDALAAAFRDAPWLAPESIAGAQGLLRWHQGESVSSPGAELLGEAVAHPVDPADQITRRRESLVSLRRAADLEDKLPGREKEFSARQNERSRRATAHEELVTELAARPTERTRLDDARVRALGEGRLADSLTEGHLRAQSAHDHAKAAAELTTELGALAERTDTAAGVASAAVEREAHLRKRRIDGMAGELARGLRAGEPCVVCGSTAHPEPAPLDEDHVTAEAIAEMEAHRAAAEKQLGDLRARNSELTNELTGRKSGSGGRTITEAVEDVREAEAALSQAKAAATEAERLAQKLTNFDSETEALQARVSKEGEWLATEESALRALRESIDADVTESRAAARAATVSIGGEWDEPESDGSPDAPDAPDAITLIENLTGQIGTLETLQKALAARVRTLEEVDRAGEEVRSALDRNGFTDPGAARAAALSDQEIAMLSTQIKRFDEENTLVTRGLAAPEVTALEPTLTPELTRIRLELAQKAAQEAASTAEQAGQRAAGRSEVLKRSRIAANRITRAVTDSAQLLKELVPVLRMATLADATSPDNTQGLTLSTYVLARRFEEVLAAANERLREMSSGRYELQRSDEKESGGGRKLGLALRILDHNTSTQRDPGTLSGGETFYVSLCLALGLADVVTAEAGGVDLGTLFVDEGFGSLDQETLDLVMSELVKLRAGGRVVGVVSHVEAMKENLSDRIAIRRVPGGSSTLTVLAGAD